MTVKNGNKNNEITWDRYSINDTLKELRSDRELGLTSQDAQIRKQQYGPNQLPEAKPDSTGKIFIRQFKSPLIYLLLGAALVVLALGDWVDGGIIIFVLFFNAVIGTFQTQKAQNTLQALKKFSETNALVLRDGEYKTVPDKEIVPGDIISLEEGDKIPADARVILSFNLHTDESSLTGESQAVAKHSEVIEEPNSALGDKKNLVFKGTNVVSGRGIAIVFATGTDTYIGYISQEVKAIQSEIPLQKDIRTLSHIIIVIVLALAFIIFAYGLIQDQDPATMFNIAVAVVVSAIPEGLPVVITLLLATGVWRMNKRQVLIKQLQAVEALGETRVIAVDKTGTITRNEMMIKEIYSHEDHFTVLGRGYDPHGSITLENDPLDNPSHLRSLVRAGLIGSLNSNAKLFLGEDKDWQVAGDPTEAALTVLAGKIGLPTKTSLLKKYKLEHELPFSSHTKYHASLFRSKDRGLEYLVVGAPEVILNQSTKYHDGKRVRKLSLAKQKEMKERITKMSEKGLRVLAFGSRKITNFENDPENDIADLVFEGLYGMQDILRKNVDQVVSQARMAGLKVIMITGDHQNTARAIAGSAGILQENDTLMTGEEIDTLNSEELSEKIDRVTVFARVSPEHKLKIISAWQQKGQIIAMTGDGVNDALSLMAADLGMAMGRHGTEVAKESSDLVLLDDNFSSIIAGVEEGRNIYKGIQKVLLFLFSTNIGEILIILIALFISLPLPVTAAQLIWLNFVTDGLLVSALAMEPKEIGLLEKPFKKPNRWLIDKTTLNRMILMASTMTLGTLFLYIWYQPNMNTTYAMTVAVTTMAVFQWFKIWNCRSENKSVFTLNPFSNLYLIGAFLLVITLQITAIYHPWGQEILEFEPLALIDWLAILTVGLSTILVDELWKLTHRR